MHQWDYILSANESCANRGKTVTPSVELETGFIPPFLPPFLCKTEFLLMKGERFQLLRGMGFLPSFIPPIT